MSDAIVNQTTQIGAGVRRLERERKLRMVRFPAGTHMVAVRPKGSAPPFPKDIVSGFAIDMSGCRIILLQHERGTANKTVLGMHELLLPFFPTIKLDGPEMILSKDDVALLADYLPLMNGAA